MDYLSHALMVPTYADDPGDVLWRRLPPGDPATDATLEYVDASTRYIWTHIYNDYWVRWHLNLLGTGFWADRNARVFSVLAGVDCQDAACTYSGTFTLYNVADAMGGTTRATSTAGRYVQYTFTGARRAYVVHRRASNCGIAYVTINGSTGLVNELPLVGDNRVLDTYSAALSYNVRTLVASGLDPAQEYTVRLTVSGQKNPSATSEAIFFEGFAFPTLSRNDPRVTGVTNTIVELARIGLNADGANEYAISYQPTGAAAHEWTGSGHLNEAITAVTWQDGEGNDLTVDAGTLRANAPQVVVTQAGTARHSETGATDHADVLLRSTYSCLGWTCYHRHAWLTAGNVGVAYCSMYSGVALLNRGHVAGDGHNIYTFVQGNAELGQRRTRGAMMWTDGKPFVVGLHVPDGRGHNNYLRSRRYCWILDRAAGPKIYVERVSGGTGEDVAPGDVWEGLTEYRVVYVLDPAVLV